MTKIKQFFINYKSTIDSVVIHDFGWEKVMTSEDALQWINPEKTMALHVNFFEKKPDLPSLKKIDGIRDFYRQQLAQNNGGLIQVDFTELAEHRAIQTIFKLPQEPSGIVYLASLTIPFHHCSYVIKIQAPEVGITGIRESAVANKLLYKGEITSGENGYENWAADPYDDSFSEGTLMNKSEEAMYDADFTKHPLTKARELISQIAKEIQFKPEIKKLRRFSK